mgnify:CR=1 FL=1
MEERVEPIKNAIVAESTEAAKIAEERDKVMVALENASYIDCCDRERIRTTYHNKIANLNNDVRSMRKHLIAIGGNYEDNK